MLFSRLLVVLIVISSSRLLSQTDSVEQNTPLPILNHSIGVSIGYSQFSLSGSFNLNTYSSKFLYDDMNDIFEIEGHSNYKLSLLYYYYLNKNKSFSFGSGVGYSTRHAKLSAQPKYLVRNTNTLDTALLVTSSIINTQFNAISLDLSIYTRINVDEKLYFFIGLGPSFNLIIDRKKSDYTSTILGLENPNKTTFDSTNITFKNGSKSIYFDNTQENDLGNSIEGNKFVTGLHLSVGAEYYLKNDLAIRIESSAQGDFTNYFKNQSLGVVSSFVLSIGVLYSGLFN